MKEKRKKNPEADAPADETATAQAESTAAPSELDQLKERLLRLQADFDNFRKRTERHHKDVCERATESVMTDMLPVLDHFELGLRTAEEHGVEPTVIQGFQMVYDQLQKALNQAGLSPVETREQPFDPHVHEAVATVPSEESPAGAILAETRRGYRLGGFVLRPAKVIVSNGPAPAAESPAPDVATEEG